MTANNRQIADALVSALITAGFEEAERKPIPYVDRSACETRKCVVICRNNQYPDGTRGDFDEIVELAIVLQKAASQSTNDDVDEMLDSVATLVELWGEAGALREAALAGATFHEGPEHPTGNIYEPQQLHELHLFTSVTTVRYIVEP